MNAGRAALGVALAISVLACGWFGWKVWLEPGELHSYGGSECGDIASAGAGSEWLPVSFVNEGDELATVTDVHVRSSGARVEDVIAVAADQPIASGFSDLAKQFPNVWATRRSWLGTAIPAGGAGIFYVHVTWRQGAIVGVEAVDLTYRIASGLERHATSIELLIDSAYSETDTCDD
jgi:hypothetical protein